MMRIIDNINEKVRDDMEVTITKGSRVSIAAACFSMYAYNELKKQLENIDEFRFIFTSPTFIKEKAEKQKREFYIPRLSREHSLYGTEFELKLRNEMTQRAIARECAEWIKKKATFKSNVTGENMGGFTTVDNTAEPIAYAPLNGFTTVDIGCERGNNSFNFVQRMENPQAAQYLQLFEQLWNDKDKMQDVTDAIIENITSAYNENSPELIYFMTLYNVFNAFLDDVSEDVLPNERTGFKDSKIWGMLYDFQRDAVLAIINKLEKYNGCILADSVGLGKTFTALAVIKYYENRNKSVLVLCPKKLSENWNTYKDNYVNNPIAEDRLNYDVLFHTDLSRTHGQSNGLDLDRLNWGNYDLVVIDESHNFRNGGEISKDGKENRYERLMRKVVRAGVKTKVLMLSATPVNNRFIDLKNQLALAYEGESDLLDKQLGTKKSIDEIFRQAQAAFNSWSKRPPETRTTDALLRTLDFDFFELLDSVTIARSRKHIEKYYNTAEIGKFPERMKPISLRPRLTDLEHAVNYTEIYEQLNALNLDIYTPSRHIYPSRIDKYADLNHKHSINLILTHNVDLIRLLNAQYNGCFKLYLLNNIHDGENGFIKVSNKETGLLINLEKLLNTFRKDIFQEIKNVELFLISMIPFMRGYSSIINDEDVKEQLTQVMHGYKNEQVDIARIYTTLLGNQDNVIPESYSISVDNILNYGTERVEIVNNENYPLLNRTLWHSYIYLYLRLLVEKQLVRCKTVNLCKLSRVVDKETNLFAVFLCKMLLSHLEGFIYTLANRNARYNNDKLTPAIALVELEHCFDVGISFTDTSFHFDSQVVSTFQLVGGFNLISTLNSS